MWPTVTPSTTKWNVTIYHRLLAQEQKRQNAMTSDSTAAGLKASPARVWTQRFLSAAWHKLNFGPGDGASTCHSKANQMKMEKDLKPSFSPTLFALNFQIKSNICAVCINDLRKHAWRHIPQDLIQVSYLTEGATGSWIAGSYASSLHFDRGWTSKKLFCDCKDVIFIVKIILSHQLL